jgi:hypothetical protein
VPLRQGQHIPTKVAAETGRLWGGHYEGFPGGHRTSHRTSRPGSHWYRSALPCLHRTKNCMGLDRLAPLADGSDRALPPLHHPRDLHLPKEVHAVVHGDIACCDEAMASLRTSDASSPPRMATRWCGRGRGKGKSHRVVQSATGGFCIIKRPRRNWPNGMPRPSSSSMKWMRTGQHTARSGSGNRDQRVGMRVARK